MPLLGIVLLVALWPLFRNYFIVAAIGGLVLAAGLHRWYERHPSTVAPPGGLAGLPRAEIYSLSSIRLAGNAGGLLCGLAAYLTLLNAFPGMGWYQLASMLVGVVAAFGLHAWRAAHPTSSTITSIAIR